MDKINQLTKLVENSNSLIFLGGAGVSSASGLSNFRDEALNYQSIKHYGVQPEVLLSYSYFFKHPFSFYDFLQRFIYRPSATPNKGHRALFKLEQLGYLKNIVTQNVDGLHQKAGSSNVLELHGALSKFYCATCGKDYSPQDIFPIDRVPYCEECKGEVRGQGLIRPNIVLYGESLDEGVYWDSRNLIQKADLLIVGGTSLTVYPANELITHCRGSVVIINRTPTLYDDLACLVINEPIEDVLTVLSNRLMKKGR